MLIISFLQKNEFFLLVYTRRKMSFKLHLTKECIIILLMIESGDKNIIHKLRKTDLSEREEYR